MDRTREKKILIDDQISKVGFKTKVPRLDHPRWAVWTLAFTRIRNQITIINAGVLGVAARRMQDAARALRSVSAVREHATTAMTAVTAAAIADIHDRLRPP